MLQHQQNTQAGFGIVELIVTVAVFGFLAASLVTMFSGIHNVQTAVQHKDTATRAAQRQIEIFRNNNYHSLSPGTTIDFTADLPSGLPRNKQGTAAISEPIPGIRRADITVAYSVNGQNFSHKFSALIGVIGITK